MSATLGVAVAVASGCSWARFSDVGEDAPVLLFKKPDKLKGGFGVSLATAFAGDTTRVLVGGAPNRSRGASFQLSPGQAAQVDAVDSGFCSGGPACMMANSVAGLGLARVPGGTSGIQLEQCFVFAIGEAGNGTGLVARCRDQTEYALPVPEDVDRHLIQPALRGEEPIALYLAADKDELASVIAGAPEQVPALAWFYPPDSMTPISLPPPRADLSFGKAVASARISGGGRLLAVAAPGEGNVYLYRWRPGQAEAALLGCLGGQAGLGRALATGRVTPDAVDDLVVSDDRTVYVLNGEVLSELPETTGAPTCTLAGLPQGALVTSFGCGTEASVEGCERSLFGAALEVADLDGDGDGEVLVGAPLMTVRGVGSAGAVLVYDVEGERPFNLHDVLFMSSAEEGDQLGRSLAVARSGAQEVVVAGAPGNEKTALFFCSVFTPGLAPRCP
ncbi:MAG: FG-GAP repeat protein [Polyangiaceae bacterium]|nr:FG-GAP repeat protein [Polyangiaceae bacterium]